MSNRVEMFAAVLMAILAVPTTTFADALYVGADLGQSTAELPGHVRASGFGSVTKTRQNDSDAAYAVFVGDRIRPWFSVELGYSNLGSFSADYGDRFFDLETTAFALSALFRHEFNESLAGFVKTGVFYATTDYKYERAGVTSTESSADSNVHFGVGADYRVGPRFAARIQWNIYQDVGGVVVQNVRIGSMDISNLSIGGSMEF